MKRARSFGFVLVVLASTVTGCEERARVEAQPRNEARPPGAAPSMVALHMRGRYAVASAMRDSIVRGALEETRDGARLLARPVALEGLPEEANAHVVAVHLHAQEVSDATTLLDASSAFATMMRSCGECHAAAGVRLSVSDSPLPAPGLERGDAAMRRHGEAVDTMWEGLLLGSTERFDIGARRLAAAPLSKPERGHGRELRALAEEARTHAREATRSSNLIGRSEHFGLLLTTCAECHVSVVPPSSEGS